MDNKISEWVICPVCREVVLNCFPNKYPLVIGLTVLVCPKCGVLFNPKMQEVNYCNAKDKE